MEDFGIALGVLEGVDNILPIQASSKNALEEIANYRVILLFFSFHLNIIYQLPEKLNLWSFFLYNTNLYTED